MVTTIWEESEEGMHRKHPDDHQTLYCERGTGTTTALIMLTKSTRTYMASRTAPKVLICNGFGFFT